MDNISDLSNGKNWGAVKAGNVNSAANTSITSNNGVLANAADAQLLILSLTNMKNSVAILASRDPNNKLGSIVLDRLTNTIDEIVKNRSYSPSASSPDNKEDGLSTSRAFN
jgi:hypothetical protein